MYKSADYGCVLYTAIINILLGLSIGMLITSLAKSSSAVPLCGLTIIIISSILAGFMAPIGVLKATQPVL